MDKLEAKKLDMLNHIKIAYEVFQILLNNFSEKSNHLVGWNKNPMFVNLEYITITTETATIFPVIVYYVCKGSNNSTSLLQHYIISSHHLSWGVCVYILELCGHIH